MKRIKKVIHHSLRVSIEDKEYQRLKNECAKTTCKSLSEYVRKIIFGKRMQVYYRNQSFDEFTEESIQLKKTLILVCDKGDYKAPDKEFLLKKIEQIQRLLNKIVDECSQK